MMSDSPAADSGLRAEINSTLRLALPVMLSQLGHVTVSLADSLMVGRLGTVPLAAASLANAIFHVILMFAIGVSYGLTPLVAQAHGRGDTEAPARYLRHALLLNFVLSLLLFLLILALGPGLALLQQPQEVLQAAVPYLNIITFSLLPLLLFQGFRQFAEGLSNTRVAMLIILGSNLINVLLNYLLIYGNWGFPALGLEGAGLASLVARIVMAAAMWYWVWQATFCRVYRPAFRLGGYRWEDFAQLLRLGIPAGLQYLFEISAFGIAVIMMGWISTEALAAHQISINLVSITYMLATGISAAATVRVGFTFGQRRFGDLPRVGRILFTMVCVLMGSSAVLFVAGRELLPGFYINDAAVVALAAQLLVVAGLFQLSDGVQVVSLGALRGLGDVKVPTVTTFVAYWLLALPAAWWLGFPAGFGAVGIWCGLLLGLSVAALSLSWRYFHLARRQRELHRQQQGATC
jgi:MATE family multidrug resistance protein